MDWRVVVVLAHVLAAFWWVAGYVGTNLCTEIARRSTTDNDCRDRDGSGGRIRTYDQAVNSRPLYH